MYLLYGCLASHFLLCVAAAVVVAVVAAVVVVVVIYCSPSVWHFQALRQRAPCYDDAVPSGDPRGLVGSPSSQPVTGFFINTSQYRIVVQFVHNNRDFSQDRRHVHRAERLRQGAGTIVAFFFQAGSNVNVYR